MKDSEAKEIGMEENETEEIDLFWSLSENFMYCIQITYDMYEHRTHLYCIVSVTFQPSWGVCIVQ